VELFGWRSLLPPCHSLFFARHSPGFGGREEEGLELEKEGMPSEEETARFALPFGSPEGRGRERDGRGTRREGLVG
jgi:hypothetical protein